MNARWLVLPVVAVLALTACGPGDDAPEPSSTPDVSVGPVDPPVSPSPVPVPSTTVPAPPSVDPIIPPRDTSRWNAKPVTVNHKVLLPPAPVLVKVRTGKHNGFERITFEFEGPIPSYDVRYVQHPTQDGSGLPVGVAGKRFLQVRFNPADAHRAEPTIPNGASVRFPQIVAWKVSGDYEAITTLVVGTNQTAPFIVRELKSPGRVYVDIASPGNFTLDGN